MATYQPSADALRRDADLPEAAPPVQGAIDYARDTAIDVGKSLTGVVGDVAAVAGNKDLTDLTDKANYWLEKGKSERGQYVTKHPDQNKGGLGDNLVEAITGMAGYIPVAAGAALTGPAAPFVGAAAFGGLGVGAFRHHVRSAVMSASEETMWQSDKYQRARGEGLDDHAAREKVYDQVLEDIPSQVIAGASGAAGAGLLTKAFGKMGSEAFSKAMTDRIIGRMGLHAAESFAGGEAMMGGQEYAGQRGERIAGIGPTESVGGAIAAATPPSLAFAGLGALAGIRGPKRPPAKSGEKKPALPIGTEQEAAAADQLQDQMVQQGYGAPQEAPGEPAGPQGEYGALQRPAPAQMRPEDVGQPPEPPAGAPPAMQAQDLGQHEPVAPPDLTDFRQRRLAAMQEAPAEPPPPPPGFDFRQRFGDTEAQARLRGEYKAEAEPTGETPTDTRSIVDKIKESIATAEDNHPEGSRERLSTLKGLQEDFATDLNDLKGEIADRRKSSTVDMEPDEAEAHRGETERLVNEYKKGIDAWDLIGKAVDQARDQVKAANPYLFKSKAEKLKQVAADKKVAREVPKKPEPVATPETRSQGTLRRQQVVESEGAAAGPVIAAAPIRTNVAALGEVTRKARESLKAQGIRPSSPLYRELFDAERGRLLAERQKPQVEVARRAQEKLARRVPPEVQEKVAAERIAAFEAEQLARGTGRPITEATARREREAAGITEQVPAEPRNVEGILDKLAKGVTRVVKQSTARNPLLAYSAQRALIKAKDRARKSVRQSPEYAEREVIAERVARSHEGTPHEYLKNLDDFLTRMYQQGRDRYALSRESMVNVAKEIVGAIDKKLARAEKQYAEGKSHYSSPQISWKIGRRAGEETGIWNAYLHEMQLLRKDLHAVANTPERQRSLSNHIVNYYLAERSAMRGEPMKAVNLLKSERRLLMDKYQARVNEMMADPSANVGEIEKLNKLIKRFEGELQGSEEAPASITDLINGLPDEDYKKMLEMDYAHAIDKVVRDDNEAEQAAIEINTARNLPPKVSERKLTPYQQRMVDLHGDGWLMLSTLEKSQVHKTGSMPTYNVPEPERQRASRMVTRAQRLNDALIEIDQRGSKPLTDMELFDLHHDFRAALGETPEKKPTFEVVQADIKRAEAELHDLSEQLRGKYETYVPDVKGHEYGLREIFNKNTDLTTPGSMPAGSFRVKVSSLVRKGDRIYGIRPDGRPANAIRHHFYDVVHRLLGDMDVVVLTPEQMSLAAKEVAVPLDSPAFYDPKSDRIFIERSHYNSPDRAAILSHEFTHPITEEALARFPDMRSRMQKMYDQFHERFVFDQDVRDRMQGQEQAAENVHEFLAHLWQEGSKLPEVLHDIATSEVQRDQYRTQRSSNVLVETLKAIKRGLTGMFFTVSKKRLLNDATVNSLEMFQRLEEKGRTSEGKGEARPFGGTIRQVGREMMEGTTEKAKDLWFRFEKAGGASNLNNRGVFMRYLPERVRRFDQNLAEIGDKAIDVKGYMEDTQKEIAKTMDEPLIRRLAEYIGKGTYTDRENRLFEYAHAENAAQVYGSSDLYKDENAWVSKTNPDHRQMINRHAELAKMWKDLNPEEQTLLKDIRSSLKQRHEDVRQAALTYFVEGSGVLKTNDPEAVKSAIKVAGGETMTPAEEAALDKDLNISREDFDAKAKTWRRDNTFKRLEGAFYPLIRRGDWMVSGKYDIPKAIGFDEKRMLPRDPEHPNRYFFANEADRNAFIDKLDDGTHGYSFKVLGVGKDHVDVNPEHFSGHDSERKAHETLERLKDDPNFIPEVQSVRKDSDTDYSTPIHQMTAVNKLIEGMKNSPGFRSLDKVSQGVMERELREMGVRHLLSSAARSKYLPRKYTLGADDDFQSNIRQYLHNTSYTLAELKHRNELHEQVKAMDAYIKERRDAKDFDGSVNPLYGENEKFGLQRSQFQREMHRRLALRPQEHTSGWLNKSINMLLKLSYMGKLASPGFHILNSTEPWLLGAPIMAGEHGMLKAYGELRRAYGTFGVGKPLAEGWADMKKVLREGVGGNPQMTDQVKSINARIMESGAPDAERLTKLIDFLHKTQYINRDAGMELGHILDPRVTKAGRVVDFLDMLSRAMGSAVEAQNRSTTAVAAYRLEFAKTGDHEKSMRYAQRVLEKSAGNYAWYNKPDIFNQQYARFALQFKQYALRVTQNYARMIVGAYHYIAKSDVNNPAIHEQNKIAMKQLSALLASQTIVSGMLGLPTEPLKALINVTQGMTGYNSDDVEALARSKGAAAFGPTFSEGLLRGIPRVLGTGLGERAAHSTLWTSGALGNKPNDWWQSIGHLAAGAPGDTAVRGYQGALKFMQGFNEYRQGATSHGEELMTEAGKDLLPFKVMADAFGVVHDAAWGKHTVSGQPTGVPADTGTIVSNLMGIRTGRQLEENEAKGTFIRNRDAYNQGRNALLQAYATATQPGEKATIRDDMRKKFNEGLPPEAQITIMDLHKYDQLYKKRQATDPTQLGMTTNRHTRTLMSAPGEVYNYGR